MLVTNPSRNTRCDPHEDHGVSSGPSRPVASERGDADSTVARQFVREADMLPALARARDLLIADLHGAEAAQVFYEVHLAGGIPDIVITCFDTDATLERSLHFLQPVGTVPAIRALTGIADGITDLEPLAGRTGISVAHLRRSLLPALAEAGWIEPLARGARAVTPLHLHRSLVRWTVTIEAKRDDWKQAGYQARRHASAADRAYVALDATRAGRAREHLDLLTHFGVGLLTVDAPAVYTGDDDPVSVVAHPKPTRPGLPKQMRYPNPWEQRLLGERCWELDLAGEDTGATFAVFGRILTS